MNAVDHNNVVIFDDRGIPSIMCRFVRPKDTEEVPAVFKIGDKVADAIYISKYPNIVIDGRAYSMPMADPTVNITFDGAVQACRCKGLGWHLMTAVEYEYLLNQSREKGTMPHGNTDVRIEKLEVELSEIPQVLKDLGIIPDKRAEEEGKTYVYFDATEGEYMPVRGSAFNDTSVSGPSALYLINPRSYSYGNIGFRSAFYDVNGKLITE